MIRYKKEVKWAITRILNDKILEKGKEFKRLYKELPKTELSVEILRYLSSEIKVLNELKSDLKNMDIWDD